MEEDDIQQKMFDEINSKEIFERAHEYSLDYINNIFSRNVFPTDEAIKKLSIFNESMPINSSSAIDILNKLNKYGNPATVATLGGRYFGFVCGSALPIGLATKSLGTYWDQAPAMNVLSPIGSKLEAIVENWFVELFELPEPTVAGFVNGTSTANLCGLASARYRVLKNNNWDVNAKGLYGAPKIKLVTSKNIHSTILKAIGVLGFGQDSIQFVNVDAQGRIIPKSIPKLDERTILILQAGNVNSGAFDNFEVICAMAEKANSWVHIDGAFGLWARAVDELKYLTKGIENASSWAVDGHKTLNTPYDCGVILCKDKEAMASAMHMSAGYIIESVGRDGMFFTLDMSRRARIIELWSTMKYLGKYGINQMILLMNKRAKQFAYELNKIEGFYIENEIVFNQVIVRCNTDEITEKVISKIQELRECWVGGSLWFDKKVIRVSICSWATTEKDISLCVKSFERALKYQTHS